METRTYDDLFALVEALCGVSFADLETARIKALINRRATKAYRASDYWPRYFVVGEERAVSSSVIPFAEGTLATIDTFFRIHKTEPFVTASAQEFEFWVESDGAHILDGSSGSTSAFVTYKAIHNVTYGDGDSDTTTVPKEWFEYIAHGTLADFLRAEGQHEKAALADQEANEILSDELMRIDAMRNNRFVGQVNTNLNRQGRNV